MPRALRLLYDLLALATAARVVVVGCSMLPTLAPGEYVLFSRLAYFRGSPQRGDLVLARVPETGKRAIVKRVAGTPGDTVRLAGGRVTVNRAPAENATSPGEQEHQDGALWALGADEYFLLGDAQDMSTDSRSFGPVPRKAIKARAWLVYWPLSRWRRLDVE